SEGVEVLACQRTQAVHRVKSRRAFVEVYNHILRKPLRVNEVSEVYGDFGVMAAESLVDRKVASKVVWENQLYYVPSR
ncbi:MAG: radical SAM protein, partial [Thermogladius sp.]